MSKTLEQKFDDLIEGLTKENEELKENLETTEDALNFILMGGLEDE